MQKAKDKIRVAVKNYCTLYREEFELFKKQIVNKKDSYGTGEMKHTDMIRRPLYEMPENLSDMITSSLELDELEYFKTIEGGRWFTKTFNDFSLISKV